jgi:MerR family transcriptional regulator, light-induced transcriptional regulator
MLSEHADEYLAAVRSGSRTAAADLLIRLSDAGIPPLEIYEHVVSATQRRIGELWQEGRLTVAQEHVATAVTEFALARLYAYLEPPDAYRGSAVVCGVQGELHQVGARIVADALEFDGWSVAFLGTNLPAQDVVEFAIAHDATLAALSVTYDAVPRLRIVGGGRPFTATAGLWRSVGADASGTDLRSAQQAAIGHN